MWRWTGSPKQVIVEEAEKWNDDLAYGFARASSTICHQLLAASSKRFVPRKASLM